MKIDSRQGMNCDSRQCMNAGGGHDEDDAPGAVVAELGPG